MFYGIMDSSCDDILYMCRKSFDEYNYNTMVIRKQIKNNEYGNKQHNTFRIYGRAIA